MTSYNAESLPRVRHFFGAYLHQDFVEDYGSADGALEAFLRDSPDPAALSDEIQQLLAAATTEDALEDACDRLGSCYYAPWNGETYRDWLLQVCRRAEEWPDATE